MNILVCGVGGQGVLLFSDLLANLALSAGLDVKKSEVHGMAQRGGSVTSHVRYSSRVFSPLIEEGTADLLVSFEQLEALRFVHFLSPTGRLIYDPLRIEPLPVLLGLAETLDNSILGARIRARAPDGRAVPAYETACRLGSPLVQNTVMLGAVSCLLEFPVDAYHATIRTLVKPQLVELNLAAFNAGRQLVDAAD